MTDIPTYSEGDALSPTQGWNTVVYKLTGGSDSIKTGSVVGTSLVLGSVFAGNGSFVGSVVGNALIGTSMSGTTNVNSLTFNASTGSIAGSLTGNIVQVGAGSFATTVIGTSFSFSNGSLIGSMIGTSFAINNGSLVGSVTSSGGTFTSLIAGNGSFPTFIDSALNVSNGSVVGSIMGLNFGFKNGSLLGSITSSGGNFTGAMNEASAYAIGSYVVSGTTNNNLVLSPVGIGSPTTWAKTIQTGTGSVVSAGGAAITISGSVGHYLFDTTYNDASPNANNGAAVGTGQTFPAGQIISGLSSDGANGYAETTASTGLPTGSHPVSIAYWVKAPTTAGAEYMFYLGTIAQRQSFFLYEALGAVILNNNDDAIVIGMTQSADTWTHWAVTYDTDDFYRVYKDGTIAGSGQTSTGGTKLELTYGAKPLTFLARNGGNNKYEATMDDFRIYDYALTTGDIGSIYNGGNGTQDDTTAGQTGKWIVPGTAFSAIPSVTLAKNAVVGDFWLTAGSMTAGSFFVNGSVANALFTWTAVG